MMKFDPMSLQRINSSIELKKNLDRGLQSILVCLTHAAIMYGNKKAVMICSCLNQYISGFFYSLVSNVDYRP
jgi:hypothetical protein